MFTILRDNPAIVVKDNLGSIIVDGRRQFVKLDGVVDESEEAAATTMVPETITLDDCIVWEGRGIRLKTQLGFLDACKENLVATKEVTQFSNQVSNSIAVPA